MRFYFLYDDWSFVSAISRFVLLLLLVTVVLIANCLGDWIKHQISNSGWCPPYHVHLHRNGFTSGYSLQVYAIIVLLMAGDSISGFRYDTSLISESGEWIRTILGYTTSENSVPVSGNALPVYPFAIIWIGRVGWNHSWKTLLPYNQFRFPTSGNYFRYTISEISQTGERVEWWWSNFRV